MSSNAFSLLTADACKVLSFEVIKKPGESMDMQVGNPRGVGIAGCRKNNKKSSSRWLSSEEEEQWTKKK